MDRPPNENHCAIVTGSCVLPDRLVRLLRRSCRGGDGARGNVLNHSGMINHIDRAYQETIPDERLRRRPKEFRVQDRTSTLAGIRVRFHCLRGSLGRGEVLVFAVPVPVVD